MRRMMVLLVELLIVAIAVFVADWLQGVVNIIPKWAIKLPAVDYSRNDFWVVFQYFLVVHALVLGIGSMIMGPWDPRKARRSINEVFLLAVAFAVAALVVFVTTTVAFDPQFVVGIFVVLLLTFVATYFVLAIPIDGVAKASGEFFTALFRRMFSIPGILAMVLAVSPGILAKLFTSDRDVANVITQIRIKFATSDSGDWTVENAVEGRQFLQPIQVKFPPGASDRMFVLERAGRLYLVPWRQAGDVRLHLDIAHRVGEVEVENGALGFALHPDFGNATSPNRGFVYLYYTSVIDGEQINRLSRFDIASGDPGTAAESETVLIELDRSESGFHNGGSVEFGPDGFLYVALGEMSEIEAHQRVDVTLSGGVIRIDVDQQGGTVSQPIRKQPKNGTTANYFIPLDNPFVDKPDALGEFFALGLRNPFRIAFDPANGSLWAGDVGSTVWEEVNRIESGGNYQFPYIEGREGTGSAKPALIVGREIGPRYTYRHTAYERAVIGGLVYRGDRYPELRGLFLFGDNYSGNIYTMVADGSQTETVEFFAQANQYAQRGITSFTETPDGEILLTTLGSASSPGGEIIRLVPKDQASAKTSTPVTVTPQVVSQDDALSLFSANCSRCHGSDGRADGPDSTHLGVVVPDFSKAEFQSSRSDEDIYAVIEQGGAARGMSAMMPPWGLALSDAEITSLVKLIRSYADK